MNLHIPAALILVLLAARCGDGSGGSGDADQDGDGADGTETSDPSSDRDGIDYRQEELPIPPPGSVLALERLDNLTGDGFESLPVTISHVFPAGHVTGAAALRIAGEEDVLYTQMDVKRRWDDGSVKHALLSAEVPAVPAAGGVDLEVVSTDPPEPGTPPPPSALLDMSELDAAVSFTTAGGTYGASLRSMLEDAPDPASWLLGPVGVEYHVSAPPVDGSGNGHNQIVVHFRVRWYPSMPDTVRVEVVTDNVWADARGDVAYDVAVTLGSAAEEVYSKVGVTHYHNARWRKVFTWGAPYPDLNYVYDVDYMIASGAIPHYDTDLAVADAVIASQHQSYTESAHDILENGIIEDYFPTTGERDDIGPYPAWTARYLLTMDPRARDVTLGCGDLAGSFSIHLLERTTGRIVSIDDRPECSPWGDQRYADPEDVLPEPVGETTTPYTVDNAHQPSLATVPYLVTGERYYLEEMYYWASFVMLSQSYTTESWGRNRDEGLLRGDQVRGQAWALRQLGDAAALGLDDDWETAYLTAKLQNNLVWYAAAMAGPPPANALGWWGAQSNWGEDGGRPDENMAPDVRYYTSPWQSDFLIWSFDHLVDLGYADAAASRSWLMGYLVGRFTHAPEFNPFDGAPYHLAVEADDGTQYEDYGTVWEKSFYGRTGEPPTAFENASCAACYPFIARGAASAAVRAGIDRADEVFGFLSENLDLGALGDEPKWALIP